MLPVVIFLGLVILVILWLVSLYNRLVRLRNETKNAWAQIDVQLKRRHDLIPNLVETAKGYMHHERETLEAVTQARSAATKAAGPAASGQAEGMLGAALTRFFAVAEKYPDLKANQNFLALQEELTSTENKVSFARQYYNDAVLKYNTACESIPTNIMASIGGFQKTEFFEIETPTDREVPQVKF